MDKYLIIGGAGIVGRFIAGLLADAGHAPIIIDRIAADGEEAARAAAAGDRVISESCVAMTAR